ncbi:MAG TPA: DUF2634 domain-containing protein [Firmicutes bacterium]|nr:DUF2634 domain-containing protein [Bacillota bacterium]
MPSLYPVFDMPELVEQQQTRPEPEYPDSYLFNFEKGEFVKDGAGRVVIADGYTAWKQWCIKAVLTQRFAFLAYSWDYGVEVSEALRSPTRKAVEMEMERTITEALLVDPRTQQVREFTFRWAGDQLWVSFVAVPVIGDAVHIKGVRIDAL